MKDIFLNLLSFTIPVSALIFLLYAITPLTKRAYAAKWRMYMWLFCALRLLLPFKITSKSVYMINLPVNETIYKSNGIVTAVNTADSQGVKLISILTVVWLVGMAAFAVLETVKYFSFRHNAKRWYTDISNKPIIKSFEELKTSMGIKKAVNIRVCKKISSPMITGFINPVLLLPNEEYSSAEAEVILHHELIHFKKHHLYLKLVLLMAVVVNWFNPFAYLMLYCANKDMELACDDEVIRNSGVEFRKKYCETILKSIHTERKRENVLTTCFSINKKMLFDRFGNILNMGKKRNGIMLCMAVCVSLLGGSAVMSFAEEKISVELEEAIDYTPSKPINKSDEVITTQAPDISAPKENNTEIPADNAATRRPTADLPEYTVSVNEQRIAENTPLPVEAAGAVTPDPEQQDNYISYRGDGGREAYEKNGNTVSADLHISDSINFAEEEIKSNNQKVVEVEADEGLISDSDDNVTAYVKENDDGSYKIVHTEN